MKNKPRDGTTSATQAGTTTPKTRTAKPIQPEIALEIEASKKRIATLKTLNKLIPLLEKMDDDGQDQVCAWIEKHREVKAQAAAV